MTLSENMPETIIVPLQQNISIFSMLTSADIVSKIVMLILVVASIYSWAVIFDKIITLRGIKKKILQFESIFWSGQVLDQLYESAKRAADNPLSSIFVSAMAECKRTESKVSGDSLLKIGQKDRVLQGMYLIRDREIEKLEKNLDFLAIIGSNALFVGLFGTVWGIMHSFQSIAASKNTSLAVVAPGIAEALLATAIGLLTAVPCVIFYSYLTSRVISISNKIEDFMGELNTILSRAIDEEKL
jgi:biopolymer transport protein TolQ